MISENPHRLTDHLLPYQIKKISGGSKITSHMNAQNNKTLRNSTVWSACHGRAPGIALNDLSECFHNLTTTNTCLLWIIRTHTLRCALSPSWSATKATTEHLGSTSYLLSAQIRPYVRLSCILRLRKLCVCPFGTHARSMSGMAQAYINKI